MALTDSAFDILTKPDYNRFKISFLKDRPKFLTEFFEQEIYVEFVTKPLRETQHEIDLSSSVEYNSH